MTAAARAHSEEDLPQLGELLVSNAHGNLQRAAAQALADEESILALDQVRASLVVKKDGRMTADWDRLMGRLYTIGLDEEQRIFLSLVLSIVGIGTAPLSATEALSERRLIIFQRAILRLRNDPAAVATRL